VSPFARSRVPAPASAPQSAATSLKYVFGKREKMKMMAPERALKGREQELPVAARHTVLGTPLKGRGWAGRKHRPRRGRAGSVRSRQDLL
jgi:hypothetical protein